MLPCPSPDDLPVARLRRRTGRDMQLVGPVDGGAVAHGPHIRRRGHRAGPLAYGHRWRPAPRDGLEMDVSARDRAVHLRLAGDLDRASAGHLTAAVAWLRRTGRVVVVDTRRLHHVGAAGDRALCEAAGEDDPGRPGPQVVVLVGPALAAHRARAAAGGLVGPPR